MSRLTLTAAVFAATLLAGCDMIAGQLGIESPEKVAAVREADGKAIGGACRHAGRAIEDCYALNKKADKASVFAGWRDMNDYMRENKIEPVTPQLAAGGKSAEPRGDAKAEPKTEMRAEGKPAADAEAATEAPAPVEKRPAKASGAKAKHSDT